MMLVVSHVAQDKQFRINLKKGLRKNGDRVKSRALDKLTEAGPRKHPPPTRAGCKPPAPLVHRHLTGLYQSIVRGVDYENWKCVVALFLAAGRAPDNYNIDTGTLALLKRTRLIYFVIGGRLPPPALLKYYAIANNGSVAKQQTAIKSKRSAHSTGKGIHGVRCCVAGANKLRAR
ncbi:hypothetical protein EVAR_27710_1 [Eumeta japonica]|uniref:Uncharacterized protein n=1 Tax=Eumeta variegata TaxID=151549 RepID=A0A4C1WRM4_EUMVA|nr:hypothetical protein EVAR_27710_1 [Eumeta japonica]